MRTRPLRAPARHVSRTLLEGWVVAIALLSLAGLLHALATGGTPFHRLWIDASFLPAATRWVATGAVAVFAGCVLLRRWSVARGLALLLGALCLADAARVAHLDATRAIETPLPPLSFATAVLLVLWAALDPVPRRPGARARLGRLAGVAGAASLSLLAHLLVVGATDHAPRPAAMQVDAIVVLGARVHHDGRPSGALEDRTHTATRLWHEAREAGRASPEAGPVLVLSGGRDPAAPRSEPEAMARLCREEGVPEEVLLLDEAGVSSRATAANVARLAAAHGWRTVAVVSHDYHLARLQWAFRDVGVRALTVPCRETHPWPGKPLAVLREMAAYAYYLLRT